MKKRHLLLNMLFTVLISGSVSFGVFKYIKKEQPTKNSSFGEVKTHFTNFNRLNTPNGQVVDFTKAAESTLHGVVHVANYQKVRPRARINQFSDPFFEEFFGNPQQEKRKEDESEEFRITGTGSGVIISSDGYITTNNHVIDGAEKVEITLNDNRKYIAKLVGTDPTTDLALLKIELDDEELEFIPFGNSDNTQVGEWVLAVGNPFNLNSTVTAGIVSAKARNINILKSKENLAIESFIQTDAAVNPGNSGGALVNLNGELIGINSAIASPTGSYAGYSFAIPSLLVKKVMEDLKEFGIVQRALLGVSIQDVTAEMVKDKKLSLDRGVYIAGLNSSGAGTKAGLKEGDVVVKADDRVIDNSSQLQEYLARFRPGDKVKITFVRGDKTKEVTVVLKNKTGNTKVVKNDDQAMMSIFGADMQSLSKKDLNDLGIKNGVRVVKVGEGKFAKSGMSDGFVITKIGKKPVATPNDIFNLLKDYQGGVLLEGIYPNGQRAYYGFGW